MNFSETALTNANAMLDNMALPELNLLAASVAAQIKARQREGRAEAIAQINAIAASLGMAPGEIMAAPRKYTKRVWKQDAQTGA